MVKLKKYKCREKAPGCHGEYVKFNSLVSTCNNPACAIKKAVRAREKKDGIAAKAKRKTIREQKQAAKTLKELLVEAQVACNKFIRMRDEGQPCISCGKCRDGKIDAGHYVAVGTGAQWSVRFHPANIHGQCSRYCNTGLSGNLIEYRKALVLKYGVGMVEYLENHPKSSFTREDSIEIKAHFMELIRAFNKDACENMKAGREAWDNDL